jgi:hypothetical protein
MQPSPITEPNPAARLDSGTPVNDALEQIGLCSTPEVFSKSNGPEFLEGREDPAQSEELERQQDA